MHGVPLRLAIVCVRLRVVVGRILRLAVCTTHHPGVVGEQRLAFADAATGVVVASQEEDHDAGEDQDDDCVADCHAGLSITSR